MSDRSIIIRKGEKDRVEITTLPTTNAFIVKVHDELKSDIFFLNSELAIFVFLRDRGYDLTGKSWEFYEGGKRVNWNHEDMKVEEYVGA